MPRPNFQVEGEEGQGENLGSILNPEREYVRIMMLYASFRFDAHSTQASTSSLLQFNARVLSQSTSAVTGYDLRLPALNTSKIYIIQPTYSFFLSRFSSCPVTSVIYHLLASERCTDGVGALLGYSNESVTVYLWGPSISTTRLGTRPLHLKTSCSII
ncbi:hypothetical protein SISSUDRAFT_277843 [Sistotremastrum suecicum HHB10207 ss-3]|uniref:Uncharacterized protein n=1 Tax=Sistotremastrum suecicum HHB10207 ss-3 TaxID=1314776 RepID=A0A165ZLE9_9AGAM|nr:hypothetical protein SISSUDRAFT_277843 [Sistotremastrum suecicum HHB10207 ss-3]